MVSCPHPECANSDKEFQSESTMRQHHTKVHGEKLPNCTCAECGRKFFHKGGARTYCDSCKNLRYKGENNPAYNGGKEKTTCEECGSEFEFYPSEKKGLFCSECVENGVNIDSPAKFGGEKGIDPIEANKHRDNYKGRDCTSVETDCDMCGAEVERAKWRVDAGQTFVCSRDCLDDLTSQKMSGEENPRWSGGKSDNRKYCSPWPKVREEVRVRDDNACQFCDADQSTVEVLHAHHIIPVDTFEREENAHFKENAILVCPSCHPKIEQGNITINEDLREEKNLVDPEQNEPISENL